MADATKLARIHRVRTLQLGLARAAEAAAGAKLSNEAALSGRIAELAATVAPVAAEQSAFSLGAAAHYRARLHEGAAAADARVALARRRQDEAAAATQAAKRDQSAVEKLIERARVEDNRRDLRALEDAPATPRKRHGPCWSPKR
jgi:flagellar FliJ protein